MAVPFVVALLGLFTAHYGYGLEGNFVVLDLSSTCMT